MNFNEKKTFYIFYLLLLFFVLFFIIIIIYFIVFTGCSYSLQKVIYIYSIYRYKITAGISTVLYTDILFTIQDVLLT